MWQKGFTYVTFAAVAPKRLCWSCAAFTLGSSSGGDWTCSYCHFSHKGAADYSEFYPERDRVLGQARERVAVLERVLRDLALTAVAVTEEGQDLDLRAGIREAIAILNNQVEDEQAPV